MRQMGDPDRGAGVAAPLLEHVGHQVGGAVHRLGQEVAGRGDVEEAAEPDDLNDLVEIAERGLSLRQHVDR